MTTLKEVVSQADTAAHDLQRSATRFLDKAGPNVESALHKAATAVRNAGIEGAAMLDRAAKSSGQNIAATSNFVARQNGGVLCGVQRMVSRNPASFVAIGAAIAVTAIFVAGSARSSSRY